MAWVGGLTLLLGLAAPAAPATAASTRHCSGYAACANAGYSHFGYASASKNMYWRMYAGHNCTNYVAYRLVKAGMPNTRPWTGSGNATNWGVAMKKITDTTPRVGAVAWWKANVPGAGSSGHVAMVEQVVSSTKIVISEDSWGGTFHWRTITKSGTGWPSGFIHFIDKDMKNTALPTMTATPQVGVRVGARAGTWSPRGTYAYQWLLDGAPISGATEGMYAPTAAMAGKRLSLRVTASKSGYTTASATSAPVTVLPGALVPAGVPTVTGEPYVGQVLDATYTPGWRPAERSRTVQWYADGAPIAGATGKRFRLTEEVLGKSVTVRVTGTLPGYGASTVESTPVGPVYLGDVTVTSPPAVSGETKPGRTLRATPAAVQPADAQVNYTWLRSGAPIPGATGTAYRLGPDDLGRTIAVRVDAVRPGYRSDVRTVAVPSRVTTTSTIKVAKAAGGPRRAAIRVRVRVPGQAAPHGRVRILVAGKTVVRRVTAGRLRVVVRGLRPGVRNIRVTYLGNSLVTPSTAKGRVRVLR